MPLRAIFVPFLLLLLLADRTVWAESLAEKLERVNAQLKKEQQNLHETKKKEQQSITRLFQIKSDLKKTHLQLNLAKEKIGTNQGRISQLLTEINETNLELLYNSSKTKKRINEIYKNSSVNYLDLLLGSKSMSDFINRSYYFSELLDKDVSLINQLARVYEKRQDKKQKLERTTREIKVLATVIEQKKNEITDKANDEKKALAQLKERRREYEARVAELEKSSEELERWIQQMVADANKTGKLAKGSGALDWPLRGRITSRFGYRRHPLWGGRNMHTGLDVAAPYGTPIRAADSGNVILADWWDGYGKAVVISHGKNTSTVYGHMSRIYVKNGQGISKGQIIGLVGSTGYSTGPHLHFEVRKNGKPQNPLGFLP